MFCDIFVRWCDLGFFTCNVCAGAKKSVGNTELDVDQSLRQQSLKIILGFYCFV